LKTEHLWPVVSTPSTPEAGLDQPSGDVDPKGEGVYSVHDWAEVHRLHDGEGLPKSAIAKRLGMSRTTVIRLLELTEPLRYHRERQPSLLDPFKPAAAPC
jgi:hypothetical protein